MAIDYLSHKEKTQLTEKVGNAASRARSTRQKLLRKLFDLPMHKMVTLVGSVLNHTSDYRLTLPMRILKQTVFTEEQARKYFGLATKPQGTAAPKKRKRNEDETMPKPKCEKCSKAGLKGRRAAHKTEDCNDEIRAKAVKKMKARQAKRASNGGRPVKRANPGGNSTGERKVRFKVDNECDACKKAGRKFTHDPNKCKFAPGGAWHDNSKDELRALQKAHYENLKKARQAQSQTKQIVQLQRRSKFCRSETESESCSESSDEPVWRREITLTAIQEPSGKRAKLTVSDNCNSTQQISDGDSTRGVDGSAEASSESEYSDMIGSGGSPQSPSSDTDSETEEEPTVIGAEVSGAAVTETAPLTPSHPGGESEWGEQRKQTPKNKMDVEEASILLTMSAAAESDKTKETVDSGSAAAEVTDVHVSDGSESGEEIGPMTTEEFLDKRAKIRRGEWTNTRKRLDNFPAESETEDEYEPQPVMYTGITFNGPPRMGLERSVSLPAKLNAMKASGASAAAVQDAARKMMPVCYMMNQMPSASKTPKTPAAPPVNYLPIEENDDMMVFCVTACASNGRPFPPGTPIRYPMFMDENMATGLFRELRMDFPLEQGQWKVVANGEVLRSRDTPLELGIKPETTVEAKLLFLSVHFGTRHVRDPRIPVTDDASDHSTGEAAAASAASPANDSASTNVPKEEDEKDMSFEVWWGMEKRMTVWWGRHRHMWRLLSALSVKFQVQNHRLILMTERHVTSGVGCVVDTDSPHTLSLKNGDMLILQHLPNRKHITSHFIPSLAVAERILKISKSQTHKDKQRVERDRQSVGSDRVEISMNKTLNEQKSPSNYTELKETPNEFTSNTSKNKRKTNKPIRIGEVKRRKGPLTLPNMRRNKNTITSHRITRVTEPFLDNFMDNDHQKSDPERRDDEKSQFRPIRLVRIRNNNYRSKRDKRQNIDLGGMVSDYIKHEKSIRFKDHTLNLRSQSDVHDLIPKSDSSGEESEDLLKPQEQIKTNSGPNKSSNDPNKKIYTPDMRYPFNKSGKLGPESYQDTTQTATTDEIVPENNLSDVRKFLEDYPSQISLSTTVENSDSDSVTEGSLPEDTEPRTDQHKETTMVNNQNTRKKTRKRKSRRRRENDRKRALNSETKEYRLLQTYLLVMDCHGRMKRIKAALDTQSNVSYAKEHLGQPRPWRSHECKMVQGIAGYYRDGKPLLTTHVIKGKDVVPLDTRTPPASMFKDPNGPEILLCAQHCAELSIDMNAALRNMKHSDVEFLDDPKEKKTQKVQDKPEHKCFISEKIMKQYMEKNGGTDKEPKQCTIDDVVIAEDFTPEQKRTVKAILHKYRDVFASSPDDIPPPMKGVEPHVFKMKQDVKPIYCKRPNWGPHQRKFLTLWVQKAIDQDLIEPAPKSQWASRPVIVGKFRGKTAKTDVPDGMRVCVDFTAVNEFIVKQPPQYTDPYEEMRKVCGHEYYFEADGQKQFNSIPLAKESRDITTTWTPLGLMRWLRLIMGTKDASGRAQQEYANSMSKHLKDEERNHLANFQDDFLGFEDDIPSLLRVFEAFLRMCRKSGIMLNPAKVRIGIRKCKFYGFILSKKGMEPSEKNLDPVKKMTIPKNSSEVRSILGVFNQFRHFFGRYDRLVLPIQKLLRKNEPFIWSKEANEGFEHVKKALLSGKLYLAAPDPTVELILETDGSDDGWGAILLQIIKGIRCVIKMWSKQWKTLHMKRSPPYYKETAAWMNGLEKSRIYIDYSPFPIKCITDHIPLTYVKNTSGKGPVSQFVLDNLSSLDYNIEYRKGSKLVEADAVSRFPCLGPRKLSPDGVKEAFNLLLASLPNNWSSKGRVWVHAQKETEIIQQLVREWLSMMTRDKGEPVQRVPYTESVTADRIRKVDYSLALWAPPADNVKQIVNEAFKRDKPFACLLPSCLINLIPDSPQNKEALKETTKIVLLRPEVTWIIHKIRSITQHQVYASFMDMNTFGLDPEPFNGIIRPPPKWNFKEWSKEQDDMVKENPKLYPKNKIHRRESDGFMTFDLTKDTTVALVPKSRRSELITWQHQQLCHSGHAKVYSALRKHWYWPDMKKDTRTVVGDCAACQLLKAKRARAHRHFRAKVFCTPRTSWGCDFYGVAESDAGYNNILGAMDLASAECRLFPTHQRTAPTVTNCVLHGIVLRDGCPLHIHSDAAREFLSKGMKKLCQIIGCKQTTTLAHHPTGNASIERLWQYVALCLKIMTNEQYKKWEKYVRLMEHVWNTTLHSVLQCTPFEAAHVLPARSVLDTHVDEVGAKVVDLMTSDGIDAMKDTAKAFEKQIYQLRQEAALRHAALARKGSNVKYKVGDEVSLFLPPSEGEAKAAGRKAKHLLFFKGPAIITELLSDTTYKLDYNGRTFYRCFSELRPYKSKKLPIDLPIANELRMQDGKLVTGNFVSLCDTDDENDVHFHLCRVTAIEDDKALLLNYATWGKSLRSAKFRILYQERNTNRYTTQKPNRNAKEREVMDEIPLVQADDYIDHYNIRMTKDMRISSASIRQLKKLGLKHHILGKTFP